MAATATAAGRKRRQGGNGTTKAKGGGKAPTRTRPDGKLSMNMAAEQILKRAKGPLHVDEIFKRAIDGDMISTKGKTPAQSLAARLAVGAKDGRFVRTAPNTYTVPGKKAPAKAKAKAETPAPEPQPEPAGDEGNGGDEEVSA